MWNEDKPYDEYQLLKRNRISFQTMILFALLVGINGFIKEYYITWAPPMVEAFVLIYIPMFYFTLMSLIKNAYFRELDTKVAVIFIMGLLVTFNLFVIIQGIIYGTFSLVEDGMLSDGIGQVLLVLFFGMIVIAAIINRMKERRAG